jgi:hypothetical protein
VAGGGTFFVDVSAGLQTQAAEAPSLAEAPVVAGEAREGQTLTVTDGEWNGTTPIALERRWQRCDDAGSGCADIPGASSGAYRLGTLDVGSRVRAVVTATNVAGSEQAASGPSAVVSPSPPSTAPAPPRVLAAWAWTKGHRILFHAKVRGCRPCKVVARIRSRGRPVRVRLRRVSPAAHPVSRWRGRVGGVPRGRTRWQIRIVDTDTGLAARSRLRFTRVRG